MIHECIINQWNGMDWILADLKIQLGSVPVAALLRLRSGYPVDLFF